jgi:hypothetical protein
VSLEHRNALEAQRSNSAELKDQLVQARLQHEWVLKEAIATGDGKVEEAWKEFADATGQLRRELEEETGLLQQALDRNAELIAQQAELERMVRDTDAQALSKCLLFSYFSTCFSQRCTLKPFSFFSFRVTFWIPRRTRTRRSSSCGLGTLLAMRKPPGTHMSISLHCMPGFPT